MPRIQRRLDQPSRSGARLSPAPSSTWQPAQRAANSLRPSRSGSLSHTAVWDNDPERLGRRLFAARCAGCHVLDGAGDNRAPDLDGWSSRRWIRGMLTDPDSPHNYGKTKVHDMKPVKSADEAQLAALTEYVWALGRGEGVDETLRKQGEGLFADFDCDSCHEVDGRSSNQGPN